MFYYHTYNSFSTSTCPKHFFFASFPCFSTGCRFSTIGPIYYEYGSMVVTFDSSTSAVQAYELVRNSAYEEKKLLGKKKFQKKQLKFVLELINLKKEFYKYNENVLGAYKIWNNLKYFSSDVVTNREAVHASCNGMSAASIC